MASAGTRSDNGRDNLDASLTVIKKADRHDISYWDYLGDRLGIPGAPKVPWLPDLVRQTPAPDDDARD